MRNILLLFLTLVCSLCAYAQSRNISGTVRDSQGQPLPGVTIVVPGTTTGTISDMDGNYSLSVPAGVDTLQASFIGYTTAILDLNSGQTDIVLEDESIDMDEVIVVAYGTQKRQAFTGSVAVVSADDISRRTAGNVTNTLAGQVPGLQLRGGSGDPGADNGKLKIRGISSLYAGTDPLVIVDGAPFDGDLSSLPPDDIESISVLKDAASAALYGARGAAGVILITTKKGSLAASEINVEARWGVNSRSVKDYDVITDPAEYLQAYYTERRNQLFYANNLSADEATAKANNNLFRELGYRMYTLPDGQQMFDDKGNMNSAAQLGYTYTGIDGNTYHVLPDDWTDEAYRRSLRQEYTVSGKGGTEKGNYFAGIGYLKDNGIIEHTGLRRFSARLKADYQIKEWLRLSANVGYSNSKVTQNANMSYSGDGEDEKPSLSEANVMFFTSRIAPIYPLYVRTIDASGNPVVATDASGNKIYDFGKGGGLVKGGFDLPADGSGVNFDRSSAFISGNPIGNNEYNNVEELRNHFSGSIGASLTFGEHWKADINSTVISNSSQYTDYENAVYGSKASVGGYIEKKDVNNLQQNHVQTVSYLNNFGSHGLTVMLGHEYYDAQKKTLQSFAQGSFSRSIPEINAFATKTDSRSNTTRYNVEGVFGTVQYNFADTYYAQGSFRRDASSRFDTDHRWGNFWSAGVAWIVSKEEFMGDTTWLFDELKVKFSIGQQGNDNIADYAFADTYVLQKASETSMSAVFDRIGNKEITWETTTNANVGLEFGMLSRRINGSFDFYTKKTTDLLFELPVPESLGTRSYYSNVGDIRNTGFELTLAGAVVRTDDLDWTLTANIAHNTTKIISLPEVVTAGNGGFYSYQLWYEEGEPLYNYMTLEYAGVNEHGEALYYYDEDLSNAGNSEVNITSRPGSKRSGTTTDATKATYYAKGCILPKFYGGFSTNLTWHGFDFSAAFDYQIGGKIYDAQYADLMTPAAKTQQDPGHNYHKDWKRGWSPNNTQSDIPRWQMGDVDATAASDRFLTNASYLNFSSAVLGYTLPSDLTSKAGISRLRVYASAENINFWSARQGLDPRYSYKSTETVSNFSPVRTISGGIQLTF